jgi:heme exporter protein D
MTIDPVQEFLAMGGYAAYVWPAWGLTVLVLGGLLATSWRSLRARERELAALESERKGKRRDDP